MKIHAELIAVADYASLSEDKKLSVMGIFDKMLVQELPATHSKLSFVAVLIGKPHQETHLKIKALSPSKKELFSADANIKFGENGKTNMVSNLEGFPFPEVGTYMFVIEENGESIAEYSLDVLQVNAPGVNKLTS